MKRKYILAIGAGVLAFAAAVAIAREYVASHVFRPTANDRELRQNQVLFRQETETQGHVPGEDGENSALLDKNGTGGDANTEKKGADYLFDLGGQFGGNTGALADNTGATNPNPPTDPTQPGSDNGNTPGQVIEITPGGDNSDNTVIRPTQPGGTTDPTAPVGPVTPTDPSAPSEPTEPVEVKDPDPVKANPPAGTGVGGITNKPYIEGVTPQEDKNGEQMIVIAQSVYVSGSMLYKGQSVDQKQIYFSLQTFVVGVDNTQYLWGAEALDKYVRIDAVSFDDGETWLTEFPVTIPEDAGKFLIRAQYRLKETDDWTDRLVDYDPADTRVMVLSENVEGSISSDQILNLEAQNPALNTQVNLFRWQSELMGQYPEKLFSGWTEDGETVPFLYPVTAGRHVLQPGAYVDIPDGFTMENKVYWMNDNYGIDGDYSNLAYLQTVIGVEEDLVANFDATGMLTIPDYVQAVDLAPKETLEVEILRVPESVLYMSGVGLRVRHGYIVAESNPNYTCQDGLLLNKDRTAILAVPLAETEVTVPKTVRSVSILADNHIRVLRLEADSMEDMPEISKESLHHCTVVVQDDLLDACILENLDVFTQGTGNRVAAASDPDTAYYVEQSALFTTTGDLVEVLPGSNQGLRFSNGIHTVKTGALADAQRIQTIVLSRDGQHITLEKDSLSGAKNLQTILCYTQEQAADVQRQLLSSGAPEGVEVIMLRVSKEGYAYAWLAGENRTVLIDAPENVTSFTGVVTATDGSAVDVNQIGTGAFANHTELKWVYLPESVTTIGYEAFRDCTALEGVLIDTREQITILEKAFTGCEALRFLASNAMDGQVYEDSLPIAIRTPGSKELKLPEYCMALVRSNATGYNPYWTMFTTADPDYYTMEDLSNGTLAAYLTGVDGVPYALIRAGGTAEGVLTLPESTVEIYQFGFAGLTSDTGFRLEWDALPKLYYLDGGAFYDSGLSGDVFCPDGVLVGDECFFGSDITGFTSAVGWMGSDFRAGAFQHCTSLTRVELGSFAVNSSLYSYLFDGCEQLRELVLDDFSAPGLITYNDSPFRFNSEWTLEEEAENLRITVQDGSEDSYVRSWRYGFSGSSGMYSGSAYIDMWNAIQMELMDWDSWSYPADEVVDAELEARLLTAENRIRTMIGTELVEKPEDLYVYRLNDNILTLVKAPESVTDAFLDAYTIGMPDGWALDYIASGAFADCTGLKSVFVPGTLAGIHSGAFSGDFAGPLTLYFYNPVPLIPEAEGVPFTFGQADENIMIAPLWPGEEESYIEQWKYPFAGYTDETSMYAAIALEHSDWTEEEIKTEMENLLSPQVARLKAMLGVVDPVELTDPAEPVDPTTPSEPTDPTEPSEPTNPTDPSEPTEPTEATEPSEETGPSVPDEERNQEG